MRNITLCLILVLIVLAYWSILRGHAQAQAVELPVVENEIDRELALALAKVTWNEASSYARPEDLFLIAQVTQSHGETNAERLEWLRRHSSCVLTDRELEPAELQTNCRWSRNLSWSLEEPAGWPQAFEWSARRRTWALVLRRAVQVVSDWQFARPCEGSPRTWGGPMDHRGAIARGLVMLHCSGTANAGYAYARRH